jgi:hypothetical protein
MKQIPGAFLAIAVIVSLVLASCPSPTGGETANKTALTTAINTAETALAAAEVNEADSPSAVANGVKYISTADKTAYEAAVTAAKAVKDNAAATQTQVDTAVSTLTTAIAGKIKTGTKTTPADKTALYTTLADAAAAKAGVLTSEDGTDVATTAYWVTSAQ